jgi:hypothetical protein
MDAYDIEIIQGSTFTLSIALTDSSSIPLNLTDYNVSGYVRYRFSDSGILTDLNATKTQPYASGIVSLSIPASGTAILPVTIARYDVEIQHTGLGTVDKVLLGTASITPEATR